MSPQPNSLGHNIDQKTECEQGEDYEVGIDFHGQYLSFACSTSGTPMQATNQPPALNLDAPGYPMRLIQPQSLTCSWPVVSGHPSLPPQPHRFQPPVSDLDASRKEQSVGVLPSRKAAPSSMSITMRGLPVLPSSNVSLAGDALN